MWDTADKYHLVRVETTDVCHVRNRRIVDRSSGWHGIAWRSTRAWESTMSTMSGLEPDRVHPDPLLHRDVGHSVLWNAVVVVAEVATIHGHGVMVRFDVDHDITVLIPHERKSTIPFLLAPRSSLQAVSHHLVICEAGIEHEGALAARVDAPTALQRDQEPVMVMLRSS